MKSVLIVGFGSIGQRHFKNFKSFGCDVSVVSRRVLTFEGISFSTISQALQEKEFDIIFVCTETSQHKMALDELLKAKFKKQIIVEKPLFDLCDLKDDDYLSLNIHVSYNLRFHPLLQKLKEELKSQKVLSSHIYVGQYLPTWRPAVDYKKSYSAFSNQGGGVLLDLSHELDFSMWLFGQPLGVFCRSGRWSDLEINSMDTCA
jgi:predicted dehydrogenase